MGLTQRYNAIISASDLSSIVHEVTKKSHLGAPEALNYPAIVISILVRLVEGNPDNEIVNQVFERRLSF
jgi:transposase